MITPELIAAWPKTDLHVHLDGSLRLGTLIELAQEQGVELPSYSEEGLKELVFKDRYKDLPDYLHGFMYTCAVLRTPEALERVAYELAHDNMDEGVRYIEVRFAPQLNMTSTMDELEVLAHVDRGLARAAAEINARPAIQAGKEPPFKYGIIGCAMRFFTPAFSPYFEDLYRVHPYAQQDEVLALASDQIVRALVKARDERGLSVVGFDLAGAERGYPAGTHASAFQYAHEHFLGTTIHAGEAYGPSSIYQAVSECHAQRIGHGTNLFRADLVDHPDREKAERYVKQLAEHVADNRITVEVCLTSNLQTMPELTSLADHPFKRMDAERLSTTFCTDNRLVSNTTVSQEVALAVEHFGLNRDRLRHQLIYGFKRSFFPGTYLEKRKYVREIIDYCYQVEADLQLPTNKNHSASSRCST